jgi:hypothetical protein
MSSDIAGLPKALRVLDRTDTSQHRESTNARYTHRVVALGPLLHQLAQRLERPVSGPTP